MIDKLLKIRNSLNTSIAKTKRRNAMSNLSTVIYNDVINNMKRGEQKTFSNSQYSELDMFTIRDLFINSGYLTRYIKLLNDNFLVSITIERL